MLFIIKRKLTAIMPYIGFPANILYQLSLYFSDCFHFHLVVCVSFPLVQESANMTLGPDFTHCLLL